MNASKQTYQVERDQAISQMYRSGLRSRQIAYNLKLAPTDVLEVIELLNLKEVEVESEHIPADHRRRAEEHQDRLHAREMEDYFN